jgi:hypothetical protein
VDVDKIISRLQENGGKDVKLLESEIRGLCVRAREIFLEQPMLLELEAPIKICGKPPSTQATSTDSSPTSSSSSSTPASPEKPTTSSWATMSTAANSPSRPSASCSPTRSKTQRTSSSLGATTSALALTAFTASMTSVRVDIGRQTQVQHQAVEDLLRRLQRHARGRTHRRENLLHARRHQPPAGKLLADPQAGASAGGARPGTSVRPAVGGPREGDVRVGVERAWSQLHLRRRRGVELPEGARHRPDLPRAPGGGGGLLVLRKAAAGDHLQRPQLLRRVRELRRSDERGRLPHVLLPDPQVLQEEEVITLSRL